MEADRPTAGHRLLPHTADVIVEAWGPRRNLCIEQAVLGLIESFAMPRSGVPDTSHAFDVARGDDAELLVAVLEEAIYLVDAQGLVTTRVTVDDRHGGGVHVAFKATALV